MAKAGSGYSCFTLVPVGSKPDHLCLVKYCRGERVHGRCVCRKHHQQSFRTRHPDKSAYATLRDHAKRKNIEFTITFEYFLRLAEKHGYIDRRGCCREDLQIDRIDAALGYVPGNIRVITCSENASKGATTDKQRKREYIEAKIRAAKKRYSTQDYDPDNCPF